MFLVTNDTLLCELIGCHIWKLPTLLSRLLYQTTVYSFCGGNTSHTSIIVWELTCFIFMLWHKAASLKLQYKWIEAMQCFVEYNTVQFLDRLISSLPLLSCNTISNHYDVLSVCRASDGHVTHHRHSLSCHFELIGSYSSYSDRWSSF
jgi:hypothetical protein